ncbi:hypothetical protein GQ54DRAFT_310722 [Martensiomyces pterosporus]|nr:hypothetical protein GQ54DRAFT_310722 [Martensiomyces pterosporus]
MFFALRRKQALRARPQAQQHASGASNKGPSRLFRSIKGIRGSFDIFALVGKEEYIRHKPLPEIAGRYTEHGHDISQALATGDGASKLDVEGSPLSVASMGLSAKDAVCGRHSSSVHESLLKEQRSDVVDSTISHGAVDTGDCTACACLKMTIPPA